LVEVLGWSNTRQKLNAFIGVLGRTSQRLAEAENSVPYRAAVILAAVYRGRLRAGVAPKLAELTIYLTGYHRPLSTLANHVIVKKGSKSAVITFGPDPMNSDGNQKNWVRIAQMLDSGYAVKMDARAFGALVAKAAENIGLSKASELFVESGLESGGIVVVPPRPHIHFLESRRMDQALAAIAKNVAFGTRLPSWVDQMLRIARQDKMSDPEEIRASVQGRRVMLAGGAHHIENAEADYDVHEFGISGSDGAWGHRRGGRLGQFRDEF
jgi:hypothetical protein